MNIEVDFFLVQVSLFNDIRLIQNLLLNLFEYFKKCVIITLKVMQYQRRFLKIYYYRKKLI